LDWTSSDDRVRGGSSYSELSCNPLSPTATFRGNLDIKTLGGAGFASQRTTDEDRSWDLSKSDGLLLGIAKSDGRKYTLTLKDTLLPKSPNGREQSTVSWEYDFNGDKEGSKVFVRWDNFAPTYRTKRCKTIRLEECQKNQLDDEKVRLPFPFRLPRAVLTGTAFSAPKKETSP
jgi:hypothetical protein